MRIAGTSIAVFVAFALAGCVGSTPSGTAPLAPVSPLPEPSLPPQVVAIVPRGTVDPLAQIRVRFAGDLIPLTALESPAERDVLAHFRIEPALSGHFRFLTPKLVGFQADAALPVATRVRVTVTAGLRDVRGTTLARDIAWSFQTRGITFDALPGNDGRKLAPAGLNAKIDVAANVALDRTSLTEHAKLVAAGGRETVDLRLAPVPQSTASATPEPEAAFDPSRRDHRYTLVPARELTRDTTYDIVLQPGIRPERGNLATEAETTGRLRTFGPLKFTGIAWSSDDGGSMRFSAGAPSLAFSNPVTPASARGAVRVAPAPADATHLLGIAEATDSVNVNPALLRPNTDYTVDIAGTLTDAFGQTLGAARRATFRTGDLAPDVWAPSGKAIFPSSLKLDLNVVSVNVPAANAIFRRVQPRELVTHTEPQSFDDPGMLPPAGVWPALALGGTPNVERTTAIPLRAQIGGAAGTLAYGIRARVGTARDDKGVAQPQYAGAAGLVQLTNLGAFVQWFPDAGFVRVHHLADGTPAANAAVEVYPSRTDGDGTQPAPAACAHGTTGADGIAQFDAAAFKACAATGDGKGEAPAFVTVVRDGGDWTYVRTESYSGSYIAEAYNGWSSATPQSRGTIFSDRELYQPGERVQATGVGWFLTDGVLARGRSPQYTVSLESPGGVKRELGRVSLDAFGTFALPIALARDAEPGTWYVKAAAGSGEEIAGTFRVAEFKPPNFKVDLTLDAAVAVRGQTVNAVAESRYLFGAPVEGGKATFKVTRSGADLAPPHRDDYTFGRRWWWPEQAPDAATDVLQSETRVDAGGRSAQAVRVADDLPYPMTYQVDAETTDVSNLSVADSKTFTALPSRTLIGLKADFVGTAGQPLNVGVIASDPAGVLQRDVQVAVQLQRAEYAGATEVVENAETPRTAVKYTTVATAVITTSNAAVIARLTPHAAGTYRIRANAAAASDDAAASDAQVWVAGAGDAHWNEPDPMRLTVALDKKTYRAGDTATVLIASPFAHADAYLAVVRHGVLWKRLQRVDGAAPTVRFTVTPDMLPNAAVEAVLVHRGAPDGAAAANGNAFVRTGFAPFDVALDGKYVTVRAVAEHANAAPGAAQSVALHTMGAAGKPVPAQLTVIVANDAVLQLTGYRPPDLVKLVYERQPLSTRFADNRADVTLQSPQRTVDKGFGYGGGIAGGETDPRVRRTFSPLAYYAATVATDAGGSARVSFRLPDDLTTWRVMAVAATRDGRFGNGETTFVAAKPLLANPVLPQFARPGDRFEGGVAVTNPAKRSGTLDVRGALHGPLSFAVDNGSQADVALHAPAEPLAHAYRFPMLATAPGDGTATFRIALGATGDAFAVSLPVLVRTVAESAVATGTTSGSATIPLDVAHDAARDTGGLDIVLSSGVLPDVLVAANAIFADDAAYLESNASRLAAAADLLRLAHGGVAIPGVHAATRAAAEIAALAKLQRADGGFAAYPGGRASQPFPSTVTLSALGRAVAAGITVDPRMLARAVKFVGGVLADPAQWTWCRAAACT
ncbi:MAG: alpha-2-macroglobulin, partial [Candidatus Velthaea sp.]